MIMIPYYHKPAALPQTPDHPVFLSAAMEKETRVCNCLFKSHEDE